jgi:hypothetical protein
VTVRRFELEHEAKDDPTWIEDLRTLQQIIRQPAEEEEEEQIEFPKPRAASTTRNASTC